MEVSQKTQQENEERVAEEYLSSLSDLNCNSKPLINMLTMLAEENIEYAAVIVKVVEQHIAKVAPEITLPILYLIDSIVKNVKSTYVQLFSQCIVNIFCGVFEKVNEKIRERMYALRQTWNEVFSAQKLYALDVKVKRMDANWPITAKQPMQPSIHVNPNFLKNVNAAQSMPTDMEEILHAKTRELLELKKRKLELELEATKKHLEEQEKQLSKATESVIAPPAEVLAPPGTVAASPAAGPRPPLRPPMVPPAGQHRQQLMSTQHPAGFGGMRPAGMYQHFRNPRPQQTHHHMPAAGVLNMQQNFPMNSNVGKAKVHPVTPSLLSSVRQRDPRLARQQQQQQSQQPIHIVRGAQKPSVPQTAINARSHVSDTTTEPPPIKLIERISSGSGGSDAASSGVIRRKSPNRHLSSNRGSSGRSSSNRSSSKNSLRDKERDRKRSAAYSSANGASSTSSLDHRRKNPASDLPPNQKSKCDDKDAFEIAPFSATFKRKSSSPASSPNKAKESKRNAKFRSIVRGKNRSRSASPEIASAALKDVDLRIGLKVNSPENRLKLLASLSPKPETDSNSEKERTPAADGGTETAKGLDKNVDDILVPVPMPMLPSQDIDLRQLTVSSALTSIHRAVVVTSEASDYVATSTSSPKVSFKIQKPFNILEKSTEHLSTVTSSNDIMVHRDADTKQAADIKREPKNDAKIGSLENNDSGQSKPYQKAGKAESSVDDDDNEGDNKKRSSAEILEEADIVPKKKIKQTKLDTLFGTEDVDLRTVPPQILAAQQNHTALSGIMTPPPPPVISEEKKVQNLEIPKIASNTSKIAKLDPETNNATITNAFKKSTLDDVRAKLAKAARYSKLGKQEKINKDVKAVKLAELNLNDENFEANDDKIRTIISQAQDLHDSGSINDEQYKNLVKTVMSLNETNKLKEAKRRESLIISAKLEKHDDAVIEKDLTDIDLERMAARDAILKKRIPKISKDLATSTTTVNKNTTVDTPQPATEVKDGKADLTPQNHEEKSLIEPRENPETATKYKPNMGKQQQQQHRSKASKWGEQIAVDQSQKLHEATAGGNNQTVGGSNNATTWHLGTAFSKRSVFSGSVPHPPLPPLPNPNLRLPQLNLPSPWQIGSGVVPPPFSPPQVPLLRSTVPPPPQPPAVALPPLPAAPIIPKPCNSIDNPQADMVRTITIDGLAKEIRIYDEIAIVFMEADQPREIGFQAGQRSIIIDNMEPFVLRFNDDFKQITIDGELHKVRFGFPSRELYIDDHWYEIYFGGPTVSIPLRNKCHMLKAEGPPPQVNIGTLRRDLVLGKINMIVNADIIIPIFLDAKVQTFRLNEAEHTVQFADNLLTVLLDGEVAPVEYGALPKRYTLGGTTYFIRFGTLPQGVIPGKVLIKDMIYLKTEPSVMPADPMPADSAAAIAKTVVSESETVSYGEPAKSEAATTIPKIPQAALNNLNIDELFQKLVSSGILGAATAVLPTATTAAENQPAESSTAPATEEAAQMPKETISPVDLGKPDTIKTRQSAIVGTLFSGMQCSSCGVRFPPEQTIKYSQHLDWHFRQNRRERDSSRKAHSRKWYYGLTDWVQYEEVEDLEEREKNFFETQQSDMDIFDDASSNQRSTNSPAASCPAGPEDVDRACDVCHEKFEQFYNEELEEWHMRSAIRVEDKIYHPLCYEDYKASLNPPQKPADEKAAEDGSEIINADDDNAVDTVIKIEADNSDGDAECKMSVTIPDDDDYDDDVIVLPNEEPSVTEIVDDDDDGEYIPASVTREEMGTGATIDADTKELNDTAESDVEIEEPNIPFTDLDTYEEKELTEGDDASRLSFLNVKIKEEPKEDDEEDDGFEDVGTVVIPPDEEISIQSSEETSTHTLAASASPVSPVADRPTSVTSEQDPPMPAESAEVPDANISLDGTTNLEPEDDHNLSTAGPAPAIPVASLMNKIKINITKNIISTNSSSSTSTTATTTNNSLNSNSEQNQISVKNNDITSPIAVISTIPVLCGGTSTTSTMTTSCSGPPHPDKPVSVENDGGGISAISVIGSNVGVSNISVIGSYGSSRYHHHSGNSGRQQSVAQTTHIASGPTLTSTPPPTAAAAKAAEKLPPPEEVIEYKLKPALEKASLKKAKKVVCGVETSGLCSIM